MGTSAIRVDTLHAVNQTPSTLAARISYLGRRPVQDGEPGDRRRAAGPLPSQLSMPDRELATRVRIV